MKDRKVQCGQKENLRARFWDRSVRNVTLGHVLRDWERTCMGGDVIFKSQPMLQCLKLVAMERDGEGEGSWGSSELESSTQADGTEGSRVWMAVGGCGWLCMGVGGCGGCGQWM